MSNTRIASTPRSDATPETELNALASVYRYILDCHAKKKAARSGGPDDVTKFKAGRVSPATDKKPLQLVHDEEVTM
jgi:hypothetical protein